MKRPLGVLLLMAGVLLPGFLNAQGNLVFNGGFDSNAAGWTAADIGANGGYFGQKGNPGGHFSLHNSLALSVPTISQTLNSFVPGKTYVISGDIAFSRDHGGPFPAEPSFGVAFNGDFVFEYATQGQLDWQSFSVIYTPSASSAILSLSAQIHGTDVSYLVDNIAVRLIPEPSAISLLLLGGGVLVCTRRSSRDRFN